jgi:outer membrane protein OmpA-like peptidoglycan-associated protein
MRLRTILILLMGTIAGCATSPPPPPSPDESTRRPVNSAAAVQLLTCQSNLTYTRLQLDEASRSAERSGSAIAQLTTHCATANKPDAAKAQSAPANTVYVVFFQYARHEIRLPKDAIDRLVADAKAATSVQVRGRTDANHDNSFDTSLAARRANAVLALLVDHGVDPTKIRVTHQGQGDLIAPNTDETRALNRRAEIEMYRAPAQVVVLGTLEAM